MNMCFIVRSFVFLLIYTLCSNCFALNRVNLVNTCKENQVYFCKIYNLTEIYDSPLLLTDNTHPDLRELIIRQSNLRQIPRGLFKLAPNLRALLVDNCGLKRLDTNDFLQAKQLKKLVLQRNQFFNLPENCFVQLVSLEELLLPQNTLHMLHTKSFSKLQKLRYLDLQLNNLNTLPEGVFGELSALEHIDLSRNEISVINEKTFAKNIQLKTIILANNKFSVFQPRSLEHLPHLHLLDISNCLVTDIYLKVVDTFLAQGATLKSCSFLQGPIKLQLNNNQMTHGAINIVNKLSVREINLHSNQMSYLDKLVGMLNLQYLDVSKNQLTHLTFADSPQYLPLPSLTYLNLAGNLLGNMSTNYFLLLSKLTFLDLAFNRLKYIDVAILEPLVSLETLYIEGNHLHIFDYTTFMNNHPVIRELGLYENEFEIKEMRPMLGYLKSRFITLPVRFMSATNVDAHLIHGASIKPLNPADYQNNNELLARDKQNYAESEHQELIGSTSIHPYWTARDIMTIIILCVVLFILMLHLYRILQDDPSLLTWCSNLLSRRRAERQNNPQPLNEEDTEV